MPNQLVLIVEDSRTLALLQKECLEDEGIKVLVAETIERAKNILKERAKEISLIILDACLNSSKPNSMILIQEARNNGFKGLIIASSGNNGYGQILLKAGANYKSDKADVPKMALLVLKNIK